MRKYRRWNNAADAKARKVWLDGSEQEYGIGELLGRGAQHRRLRDVWQRFVHLQQTRFSSIIILSKARSCTHHSRGVRVSSMAMHGNTRQGNKRGKRRAFMFGFAQDGNSTPTRPELVQNDPPCPKITGSRQDR